MEKDLGITDAASDLQTVVDMAVEWLDDANVGSDIRVMKIAEECGDVISAWIMHTRPELGRTADIRLQHVLDEMADVVITTLVAMSTITSMPGKPLIEASERIRKRLP